jgi:prophage regulatory protein
MRILRVDDTLDRTGDTRSPLYDKVSRGLFTRPVKVGERAAGWPEHEIEALIAARVAGASVDQIRQLVEKLHQQRTAAMPALA